ncbi:LOW QUALITY PROTEIN: GATA transcription factor 9-like [Actinidia eriantha]|uniref:LOW QUALITY PROTEIN: GATA transcription factor 9-like n=1 Tax=Actinidia eriantha TaxID=165200 RepID=UPI002590E72B|nr:LOW QUALITY PROTEIN: GATA transcription factor 9-like [Actinidia eriantha]
MEAPGFFADGLFGATGEGYFSQGNRYFEKKSAENVNNHFVIDDLLDFSKEDDVMTDAVFDNVNGNSTDSSTVTAVDSCNSSVSGGEHQFSGNISCRSFADAQFAGEGELCVPYDDLAELEWLSNFVEDSFSSDDLNNLQLISASNAALNTSSSQTPRTHAPIFITDVSVPGKARSKRSRAAPCDWSSRLLLLSPSDPTTDATASKTAPQKRDAAETPGRKCLHCASEKTPQWRTGPMGPKTLCNACGVRFKSGRLVPEYRPAASPTFVSARHSNSHRKVLEMRRQKEIQRQHEFLSQSSVFAVSNGDDYLIHHQGGGPDYSHLI